MRAAGEARATASSSDSGRRRRLVAEERRYQLRPSLLARARRGTGRLVRSEVSACRRSSTRCTGSSDPELRFALLGSSARKLRAAGTNLLAGRALRKAMTRSRRTRWAGTSISSAALRFGTLPLVVAADDRRAVLESYVQLYVRQEIQSEALVRNLPGFIRFLPIAALFHGQVVNVSGIARDCGVARTTVEGYLEILEDTLLTFRLPAFEARLRVRERRHPKLYWVDAGARAGGEASSWGRSRSRRGGRSSRGSCSTSSAPTARSRSSSTRSSTGPPRSRSDRGRLPAAAGPGVPGGRGEVPGPLRDVDGGRPSGHWRAPRRRAPGARLPRGTRSLKTEDGIEVWPFERFDATVAAGRLWP